MSGPKLPGGGFVRRSKEKFHAHPPYRSLKFIEGTEKSHSEAHETSTLALRAVNDAVQELARFATKPAKVENKPKEPTDR
jgi:hypothetical protein